MLFYFLKRCIYGIELKKLGREGLTVGKNTLLFLDTGSFGTEPYLIHIGDNCLIANGVKFITHDGAIRVIKQKEEYKHIDNKYGKIEIRDNVYIGENSIIMPNVTIGPNACVMPGSVVYKDIPPETVAAGNPACIKKKMENFQDYYKNELYPYYKKYYCGHYKHLT